MHHSSFDILQSVALKPAVQGAAAQTECFGGLADVAVEASHGLLDQEALNILEAHVFEAAATVLIGAKSEVARLDQRSRRHEDGSLDGVIELADVPGPAVLEQDLHRAALEAGQAFAVALRVLTKKMLREKREIFPAVA